MLKQAVKKALPTNDLVLTGREANNHGLIEDCYKIHFGNV